MNTTNLQAIAGMMGIGPDDTPYKAHTRFRKKLESYAPISDADFPRLAKVMHIKQFRKGELLLKEGQVSKQFYFILRGSLRCFSLENSEEKSVAFYFEDDLASDFDSFRSGEPSQFSLIAREDTTVYYGTKAEVVPILQTYVSFHLFLFRFFQSLYIEETKHSNALKLQTPENCYYALLKHKPHYLQRIPLTRLASYLGISRETLTRIRRRFATYHTRIQMDELITPAFISGKKRLVQTNL